MNDQLLVAAFLLPIGLQTDLFELVEDFLGSFFEVDLKFLHHFLFSLQLFLQDCRDFHKRLFLAIRQLRQLEHVRDRRVLDFCRDAIVIVAIARLIRFRIEFRNGELRVKLEEARGRR